MASLMGYYITVTKGWTIDKVMGKVWRKYKKNVKLDMGKGWAKYPQKMWKKLPGKSA